MAGARKPKYDIAHHTGIYKAPDIAAGAVSLTIIFICYPFPTFPREVGKRKVSGAYNCWVEFNRGRSWWADLEGIGLGSWENEVQHIPGRGSMIDVECEDACPPHWGFPVASCDRSAWILPVGSAYRNSFVSTRKGLIYWLNGNHCRFLSNTFPVGQHLLCLKFKGRTAEVVQGPGNLMCHQFSF